MRSAIASVLLFVACGGSRAPAAQAGTPVEIASASPSASASSAPPKSGPRIYAKTSMAMDGPVSTPAIMKAVDERATALGACIPAIRKTDKVVGSLNLQVTVNLQAPATVELQSPLNDEAKKCVLDALADLKVGGGPGRAMVLLEIED
jgi:hypothetical protein